MRLTQKQVNDLCDYLQGTALSIEDGLSAIEIDAEPDELDMETLARIDEQIFVCDECGWNCEAEDMADNPDGQYCQSCAEDLQ